MGNNDAVRTRRFQVLQLYLKNATPPEIADYLNLTPKQVYKDIDFLRSQKLEDLPLEIIRDLGKNFFEMKVRELEVESREQRYKETPDYRYIANIEKLILSHKIESLKIQGAYQDQDGAPKGPIQIIFEKVGPDYGKNNAEYKSDGAATEEAR